MVGGAMEILTGGGRSYGNACCVGQAGLDTEEDRLMVSYKIKPTWPLESTITLPRMYSNYS